MEAVTCLRLPTHATTHPLMHATCDITVPVKKGAQNPAAVLANRDSYKTLATVNSYSS